MAKVKIFSVYDSKTLTYANPFYQHTTGEALRSFTEISNDEQSMIGKHPEDFALMELGSYDSEMGSFDNLPAPLNLGLATQYKRPATNNVMKVAN